MIWNIIIINNICFTNSNDETTISLKLSDSANLQPDKWSSPVPINKSLSLPLSHTHASHTLHFSLLIPIHFKQPPGHGVARPGPRHQPFIIQPLALWMAYRWMLQRQPSNNARKSQTHTNTHTLSLSCFWGRAEPEDAEPWGARVSANNVVNSPAVCILLLLFN